MGDEIAYLQAIVGADISDFRRGMAQVRSDIGGLSGLSAGLQDLGRDLTYALTIPLALAGGAALKMASDFDSSMRNINSILQLNESQYNDLSKAVLDYGSNIRAGPIAASEALYQIVSAGITDQATAMAILTAANNTAEAGQANLQTTTKALTTTMLAYGASAKDASDYSNVLTRTVQLGVGTMDDFTSVLGRVAPSAASIGLTFQEVGETLAFLTQRGLSAAMASSSLNSAINTLLKPGQQLQDVFAQLGVSSGTELIDKFGGLEGAIKALYGAVGDKGDVLAQMFTAQGRRAVLDIVNDLPAFNDLINQFGDNLDNATSSARTEQMKSFAYQFDLTKSAIQGAAIALGDKLMPLVSPLFEGIRNVALSIEQANPNIISLIVGVGLAVAAVGPLITILGALLTPVGLVTGAIAGLAIAFATNFGGVQSTIAAFIATNFPALQSFIDLVNNLISTVTSGTSSIALGRVTNPGAQMAADQQRQLGELQQQYRTNLQGAGNSSQAAYAQYQYEAQRRNMQSTFARQQASVGGMSNIASGINGALGGGEQALNAPTSGLFGQFSNIIQQALQDVRDWITGGGLAELIGEILTAIFNAISSVFKSPTGDKLSLAVQFVNWVGNLPYELVNAIKSVFSQQGKTISVEDDLAGAVQKGGFDPGVAFGSMIKSIGDWFLNSFVPGVAGAIGTALGMLAGLLTQLIAALVSFIQTGSLSSVGNSLAQLGENVGNSFLGGISNGFNATANQQLVQGVQNTIGQLGAMQTYNENVAFGRTSRPNGQSRGFNSNPIGGTATGLAGSENIATGVAQKTGGVSPIAQALGFDTIGQEFNDLVVVPIQTALDAIKSTFTNIGNDIKKAMTDTFNALPYPIQMAIVTTINGVIGGLNSLKNLAISFISDLTQKVIDFIGSINSAGQAFGLHIDTSGLEAFKNAVGNIADIAPMQMPSPPSANQPVQPIPTQNLGSVVSGRAAGGPVMPGRAYGVGDTAYPEIFMPSGMGSIMNLSDLLGMLVHNNTTSSNESGSHHNTVYINNASDVEQIKFELKRQGIDLELLAK